MTSVELTDERDLNLQGTEEDLRQQILDDPTLIEPGFQPLATERPTPAGAIDIYGEDEVETPVVVELKRRRLVRMPSANSSGMSMHSARENAMMTLEKFVEYWSPRR